MNTGRFQNGVTRTFLKICDTCVRPFESKSGSRKRCQNCCKCKECGAQMPNASHKFCCNSCAGKWKYKNSDAIKQILYMGTKHPNRGKGVGDYWRGRSRLNMRGINNPNWKGGTGSERHTAMGRLEYKIWRASIFKRDDYACILCKSKGKIHANHIIRWADDIEKRYNVTNGVTLCIPCHQIVTGNEQLFKHRFVEYVEKSKSIQLTDSEIYSLMPLITNCDFCGTELKKEAWQRKLSFHFCNEKCRKTFEHEIGWKKGKELKQETLI